MHYRPIDPAALGRLGLKALRERHRLLTAELATLNERHKKVKARLAVERDGIKRTQLESADRVARARRLVLVDNIRSIDIAIAAHTGSAPKKRPTGKVAKKAGSYPDPFPNITTVNCARAMAYYDHIRKDTKRAAAHRTWANNRYNVARKVCGNIAAHRRSAATLRAEAARLRVAAAAARRRKNYAVSGQMIQRAETLERDANVTDVIPHADSDARKQGRSLTAADSARVADASMPSDEDAAESSRGMTQVATSPFRRRYSPSRPGGPGESTASREEPADPSADASTDDTALTTTGDETPWYRRISTLIVGGLVIGIVAAFAATKGGGKGLGGSKGSGKSATGGTTNKFTLARSSVPRPRPSHRAPKAA